MIRLRTILSCALVLALAVVLAACGSSSTGKSSGSSGDNSPAGLLKDTFGPNHPVKSGKLDLALTLNLKGSSSLNGPVTLDLNGPFQSQGKGKVPLFDLDLAVKASGLSFTAGAVSTGDDGYLKLQGTSYDLGQKVWGAFSKGFEQAASKPGAKGTNAFSKFGIDPVNWLTDPKIAGTENIGGADTTHITAGIDISKLLTDVNTLLSKAGSLGLPSTQTAKLPTSLTPSQTAAIKEAIKSATLDVFTGKDDTTLRRLALGLDFVVPQGTNAPGGIKSGNATLQVTISNLNEQQTITAPTGAKPLSELQSQVQGLLGAVGAGSTGATGATSTGSGTSSSSPAVPSGASATKYYACLKAAGSDIAKVQQCASLVAAG